MGDVLHHVVYDFFGIHPKGNEYFVSNKLQNQIGSFGQHYKCIYFLCKRYYNKINIEGYIYKVFVG